MRISLKWLNELVAIGDRPEELARTLTIAGFEVESIEDLGTFADGVVIGKVIDRQPHPNADKLSVCQVDVGGEAPLNIVCGASNVRADIYVPVATIGTYLPAIDLKLKRTKLRGVSSEGMICSLAELGLEKDSEGIYIFPEDKVKTGEDVRPLLGLDDVILDLTATANRADALSMVGVAREVAALTGASVKLPQVPKLEIGDRTDALSLNISDDRACPIYIGTVVESLKIAPSPDWLKSRLQAAGIRSINNVVDITNYILIEWGQPLHAFDRDRLITVAGSDRLTIGVRFATEGESFQTLDGQTRNLVDRNLLITANDRPVALAGVMGGEETEVYEDTTSIVLEAAIFDPVAIRRSSRAQGLRTEASTRYERGVNLVELDLAHQRAIALIVELAEGKVVTSAIADARPDSNHRNSIELRLQRLNEILGSIERGDGTDNIQAEEVEKILTALGCQLEKITDTPTVWKVTVPPYRYRDLEREIDLIEEVARLYGYDRFCNTLPNITEAGYLSQEYIVTNQIRKAFCGTGLTEVVQYSLVKPELAEVTIANPLLAEYSALRKDLVTGLIEAFEYNQSQGNGALNAFEIGRIFRKKGDDIEEADAIAGILGGDRQPYGIWTRSGKESPLTWYEAKGILESALKHLGVTVEYQSDNEDVRLHPGRTASLWIPPFEKGVRGDRKSTESQRLGIFGQLHPELRQQKDFPDEVYVFELSFDVLLAALDREDLIVPKFQVYSTYPGTNRDLAFFAPVSISVAEIIRAMKSAGGILLDRVEMFDRYLGANVPEGQHSLAFSLKYRASDRTLTDEEVEPVHQKIRNTLVEQFQVTPRS
ncbi:MAG: phenylalanine--tRNA ligase subunit beta [Xenococcaceae cyanobacterium]